MQYVNHILADSESVYNFLADCPALPEKADLILAAGTHDLRVADHAADLYQKGYAPVIVCTGGYGKVTKETFDAPEAEKFAERCIALGVPESAIVVENKSSNTGENFLFARELCRDRGFRTGIIACKPYMAKRAWATGTRQWPEVKWYASGIPLSFYDYPETDISLMDTISLMVGDLQRMRVYEEAGYQSHVDVPDSVWEAYKRLCQAGYDQYVIQASGG